MTLINIWGFQHLFQALALTWRDMMVILSQTLTEQHQVLEAARDFWNDLHATHSLYSVL